MTTTEEPRIRKVYTPSGSVGHYWSPEEDRSVADLVASMPDKIDELLAGVDEDALQWDASFWCRPSQLQAIDSKHWLTVALAGRGWGKSYVLSRAIHKYAMEHPGCRMALVGRTTSDVRDVMILGDSGIMSVINPAERPEYKPAVRRLLWANGSEAITFSAERPDGIRGPQFHASFCDEVGSYRVNPGSGLVNAFDQIKIATRLTYHHEDGWSSTPQIFVATTPRRVPTIMKIVQQAEEEPHRVMLIRGSTLANRNLSDDYKETMTGLYAGTALGKQELDGELLADVEGALLPQTVIDNTREAELDSDFWQSLPHRVVGVDPSVSSTPNDECGIIVVGATGEKKLYKRQAYVLEDASILGSPDVWAKKVVEKARQYKALVVAEKNQGGELVKMVIQAIDPRVPVVLVHASVGKFERAEPVGAAYERGAVHHVDWFTELESQLTGWAPNEGMASPDRMDALVHAVTSLLITPPKGMVGRISVAGDPSKITLPIKSHDPRGPIAPNTQFGRNAEEALKRLAQVEGVRPEDVKPHEQDDELRTRKPGRARRPSQLPIGNRTKSTRSAFGAPTRSLR